MIRTRTRRRAGFTLIEVLVALLIVGGMMLAITQILEATRLSRDRIHNIQESQLAGPAIMDLIERDLRGLFVYNRDGEHALRVVDRIERGLEADSLDFVTSTNSLVPSEILDRWIQCDYNEVGYRLRPNPEDDDYLEIYRREGFGVDDEPFEGGAFTFLHDQVKHFSVQVFAEDGPDAEPLQGWSGTGDEVGLPLRLEISLTLDLAPRVAGEQLLRSGNDAPRVRDHLKEVFHRVTYRRVMRLPQSLLDAIEVQPVPVVPRLLPTTELAAQGAAPAPSGGQR